MEIRVGGNKLAISVVFSVGGANIGATRKVAEIVHKSFVGVWKKSVRTSLNIIIQDKFSLPYIDVV